MKAIVVMNGEFYAGENAEENILNFSRDKKQAVKVDERRLRYITQCVLRWSMDGTVKLKRLEILEANGGEDKCVNVVSAKLEPVNAKIVQKMTNAVM